MPQWTVNQLRAIENSNHSLLVAAAAGSGKTAVLVERIIEKISNPDNGVDIDQLLVVTFTNAAAMEMKERIGAAIYKQLKEHPGSIHLYNQSILLNKANIMTLHSFCLELVREHFYRLDLDPNFRIADETEGELLKQDALEEVFEEFYLAEEMNEDFFYLVDSYGGKDDYQIHQIIINLLNLASSQPNPESWLKELSIQLKEQDWITLALKQIRRTLEYGREHLRRGLQIAREEEGLEKYVELFSRELQFYDDLVLAASSSWDAVMTIIGEEEAPFKRMPAIKKGTCCEQSKNEAKKLRDDSKKIYDQLTEVYLNRREEEINEEFAFLSGPMNCLTTLAQLVKDRYQEKKREKNIVDFNDMEHYCLALLGDYESKGKGFVATEISKELRGRFQEVLVDEYQDINDVQEAILSLVSRPSNLFMVGDVKQSIYSFRMANPKLFTGKYQSYPLEPNYGQMKIDLNQNFRCRKNIVDGVNFVFHHLMCESMGGIPYDEAAQLQLGAIYPDEPRCDHQPIEVYLLEDSAQDEWDDDEDDLSGMAMEGKLIGQRINQLINEQHPVWDKEIERYRPINYSDIVILLRSPRNGGEDLLEQLKLAGIPATGDNSEGYFAAWEVQIMLALLHVLDNPQQDIPLVAVLHSPFFQFTADDLSIIRINSANVSFYQALVAYGEIDSPLGLKSKAFLHQVDEWRTLARRNDLSQLIWQLYKDTHFYQYVGSLPMGRQRQRNLMALYERAKQYEETSFRGLFMFLRFIDKLKEMGKDLEIPKNLGENENVVKIMSIHKSKGLEFPVVFVANLSKRFNLQDTYKDIIIHKDLGLGPSYVDPSLKVKYPTIANQLIRQKMKDELLAEEIRVLYVALTRAREKLILVGSVKNKENSFQKWGDFQPSIANSYSDWIMPILTLHPGYQKEFNTQSSYQLSSSDAEASFWNISLSYNHPVTIDEPIAIDEDGEAVEEKNVALTEEIVRRLDWLYPEIAFTNKKSKVTATEVKHRFTSDPQEEHKVYGFTKRPVQLQENRGLSPAEKGTALHLMMSKVKLEQPSTIEDLTRLADYLVTQELLTKEQRDSLDLLSIQQFLDSPLGIRMQKYHNHCHREQPFSYGIKSNELHPELPENQNHVLVQGMIDCLWKEEDGWVLLDYKSDYVTNNSYSSLINQYSGQVNLYARAVEEIWGEKIKEKYIYLFAINKAVKL